MVCFFFPLLLDFRRDMFSADQVEKIVRKTMVEALQQEEEAEPEQEAPVSANKDEDVEVSDDRETRPKPKPRKKREKKIVPVGRNGLKKRRVMKSRMRVDEKGYMGMWHFLLYFC